MKTKVPLAWCIPVFFISVKCWGGVTGCPKTISPYTNVLWPLVPKLIVLCDTMSLYWYILVIVHHTISIGWCKMAVMYQCRDIELPGRFILGTRGLTKFVRGHIVSGRPVTPPTLEKERHLCVCSIDSLVSDLNKVSLNSITNIGVKVLNNHEFFHLIFF